MNQQFSGIIKAIRFLRSTLAVVALVFVLLFLCFIIVLFCPIEPIAKYVLIGVFVVLSILVWRSFWEKAKEEPLTVSETYWIAALPYTYGSNESIKTRQEELELPKEMGEMRSNPNPQIQESPEKEN